MQRVWGWALSFIFSTHRNARVVHDDTHYSHNSLFIVAICRQQRRNKPIPDPILLPHYASYDENEQERDEEIYPKGVSNLFDMNLLDNSPIDNEQRPARKRHAVSDIASCSSSSLIYKSTEEKLRQFGVEFNDSKLSSPENGIYSPPTFPSTIHSVAYEACYAITHTLYNQHRLDPNIVSNARAVSRLDKRPVAFGYHPLGRDVGRIGIEIDGARFLSLSLDSLLGRSEEFNYHTDCTTRTGVSKRTDYHHLSDPATRRFNNSSLFKLKEIDSLCREAKFQKSHDIELEGKALRIITLIIAAKLSKKPWDGLEDKIDDSKERVENSSRPVAVFFNSIQQTLLASKDLHLLKSISRAKKRNDSTSYDNIRVCCLGQDTIPTDMLGVDDNECDVRHKKTKTRNRDLDKGAVQPSKGIIVIMQPSDYNKENPPSPSTGTLRFLQSLLARASIEKLPSVIVSPRLTEQYAGFPNGGPEGGGFEQSVYQKASIYGGEEPPRGPTPFLLRDFIPPVFSWVGCALPIVKRHPSRLALFELISSNLETNSDEKMMTVQYGYYSRVAMTQSIMRPNHAWEIFAVEESLEDVMISQQSGNWDDSWKTKYCYLCSSKTFSGRPNKGILKDMASLWLL